MEIYYTTVFFLFGTIFGSFFNVVGSRIPNGESIVNPPSHCTNCNHQLTWKELIPILSFLFPCWGLSQCSCSTTELESVGNVSKPFPGFIPCMNLRPDYYLRFVITYLVSNLNLSLPLPFYQFL